MNNDHLVKSLKLHEGCKLKAYQDSLGIWTIGIGKNLQELEITEQQAEAWLIDDIYKSIKELDRAFPGWRKHSEARQNVLIEMTFNLGAPRLAKFKRFWTALSAANYKEAATEMLLSKWAEQVGQRAKTLARRLEADSFD